MKVVLATGIYPPDIGGPATYVKALAGELAREGVEVRVVTYGGSGHRVGQVSQVGQVGQVGQENWMVSEIQRTGGPLMRWRRYARALRREAADADIVEAFSAVSAGIPLLFANLKKPKKVLRLGGDFFWERYTAMGGSLGLREWYEERSFFFRCSMIVYLCILRQFDHIVFSTRFQEELYERHFRTLPRHCVIENAIPSGQPRRSPKMPDFSFRLLFVGRFVGFKNLPSLIQAMVLFPGATLTLSGEGPMEQTLRNLVDRRGLHDRVKFLPPCDASDRLSLFNSHDLLVLPSLTEISPNVALEARSMGLPVLLTKETGLSQELTRGMRLRDLSRPEAIAEALGEMERQYGSLAGESSIFTSVRTWHDLCNDHLTLFADVLRTRSYRFIDESIDGTFT